MSYLRRNIRDLTSKLIAANGGELSDTMKEALSDFSARLLFIAPLDNSERKQKAHAKRQRRRDQRRKMGEDLHARQEEYLLDEYFWRYGFEMDEAAIEREAADAWFEKYAQQERSKYWRESERAWRELESRYPEAFGHCETCSCCLYY